MAFAMKSASTSNSSLVSRLYIKAAFFHSTPVLDRRRRKQWDYDGGPSSGSSKRSYNYSRRFRKVQSQHTLLRNVSDFAECLFQSWQDDDDFNDSSSNKGTSWFKGQDWGKRKKQNDSNFQGPQWGNFRGRGGFSFCDEDDVEVIFRSAFGGERCTYWSFIDDDSFKWRSSNHTNNRNRSWKSKYRDEDEYDTYEEYNDDSISDLTSDRLALGLSASGPLKLEDVKNAYRTCALKWHPDRHQGSSKANAEEKFKHCSAAYQSLCDKLE
ncbi:Chaperone dnaj-domain superfamily protein [Thalictrum thalictroides]|uniref:Chaperone dnaj-domain superfamily protein n=1 Tax=Thalictrum thalictroides TaxID=46969 RepID=A0A7J6VBZ7_THATH|nr:Chaperone dnaj-domain superfamily protein [Thalictrum thalictroides]